MISDSVKELSKKYFKEVKAIREHLHSHPEVSFHEFETQAFIISKLKELELNPVKIAGTGVFADIITDKDGPVIALRADIDALPVTEKNEITFKSLNQGVMHACGHDVHTACLLGTAMVLLELKNELRGRIRLIFQPAEEKAPGGAHEMINQGVLKNPDVDLVIAQHTYPELEAGEFGFHPGPYLASSDEIYITVKGKGGHAAMPWKLIDPVATACQVVVNLQQVVSRHSKALIPTVLSFGRMIGDGVLNVIPDEVRLEGTFRTYDEQWRQEAHTLIRKITENVCEAHGAKAEIEIRKGYPSLSNNPELSDRLKKYAIEFAGNAKIFEVESRMTSEDFSYFANTIPSCLFRLGIANNKKGISHPLHSAFFNVDDQSLLHGVEMMSYLTTRELLK